MGVTKKIVRPRKIILGQKVAMKFAPINVRRFCPAKVRTTMMAYKRQLPAPAGVKLRNGLRASVRRRSCGAGMSVLDGEAVPR